MTKLKNILKELIKSLELPDNFIDTVLTHYLSIASSVSKNKKNNPLVCGINGAQGAGKSTFCLFLKHLLELNFGLKTVVISIDDFYLTKYERKYLGKTIHPLLVTRGVPGTHDTELGIRIIKSLKKLSHNDNIKIPTFDKAIDDRTVEDLWPVYNGPIDIILFEGWCVGAKPQEDKDIIVSINRLEQNEDHDCVWRRYINYKLKKEYAQWFSLIDYLIMLKVPDMKYVTEWRTLQENKLSKKADRFPGTNENSFIMGKDDIDRFIMHFERLTLHMMKEIPLRANIILNLNQNHQIDKIDFH